jgi:ketosteroid isomerase-like protein
MRAAEHRPAISPRLQRLVEFFEQITPQDADRMGAIYTDDALFKDPFNEVRGVSQIARIFSHMFHQVDRPRFVVKEAVESGEQAFLIWDFEFAFRAPLPRHQQVIRGASHLRFAPDDRVEMHRDYWDAAEELYAKLPVLGGFMRFLRRRGALSG